MSRSPIFFQFDSQDEAQMAQSTLEELGYQVNALKDTEKPLLHIHVDRINLASALEIAQAHGGRFTEREGAMGENDIYAMAYDQEGTISIPAHLVNEDRMEEQDARSASLFVNKSSGGYQDNQVPFDPSGDDYNGFDAGVRL